MLTKKCNADLFWHNNQFQQESSSHCEYVVRREIVVALTKCLSGHLCFWGSFKTHDNHILVQNRSSGILKTSRKSIAQNFKIAFWLLKWFKLCKNGKLCIRISGIKSGFKVILKLKGIFFFRKRFLHERRNNSKILLWMQTSWGSSLDYSKYNASQD